MDGVFERLEGGLQAVAIGFAVVFLWRVEKRRFKYYYRRKEYDRGRKGDFDMTFDELWDEIVKNQGKLFYTVRGMEFIYSVKCGCIYISRKDKAITKATVKMAYEEAVKLNYTVKGPKKLKCFGASYLYPVFLEVGVVHRGEGDEE